MVDTAVSQRIAPDYDALWHALRTEIKELLTSTQIRMLNSGGASIEAFAREALTAQGQWLAIQDVCALIQTLEDAEREGRLGEEDTADAPNGRGNRGTTPRDQSRPRRSEARR